VDWKHEEVQPQRVVEIQQRQGPQEAPLSQEQTTILTANLITHGAADNLEVNGLDAIVFSLKRYLQLGGAHRSYSRNAPLCRLRCPCGRKNVHWPGSVRSTLHSPSLQMGRVSLSAAVRGQKG
jgi:hypothetical protein